MDRCTHSEARLDGKRAAPPAHDCAYVDARNRLIPQAEREAARQLREQYDEADLDSTEAGWLLRADKVVEY